MTTNSPGISSPPRILVPIIEEDSVSECLATAKEIYEIVQFHLKEMRKIVEGQNQKFDQLQRQYSVRNLKPFVYKFESTC